GLLDPAQRLGLDLEGIGGRFAYAWGSLLNYVRTGAPAYHKVFGLPFWEDLDAHPAIAASFDALIGPEGHGVPDPEFQLAGGWESVRTVVDVGGGTGAMLAEIVRAGPGSMALWSIYRGRWLARWRCSSPPVSPGGSQLSGRASSTRCRPVGISIC